jgi:DNA-binding transcriptional regulator YdaS (Cro superfamily)
MDQVQANAKVVELANGHAEVARILGYKDRRNVWKWTSGLRPFPPKHCVTLEQHFGADKVSRRDLRPHDWKEHWPELERRKAVRA